MDEYIKKSDVLEYLSLRRNQVLKSPLSTLDAKFEVMEIFDFVDHRVESADVVPIVRCRECIHRTENGNCGHPRHEDTLPTAYPNDFCSYGKRKRRC